MLKAKLANIYGQLATLFGAGMPVIRSLEIIADGQRGLLKKVFSAITDDVSKGSQIHEAMAKHKNVFEPFDIAICQAAEWSGNISQTMKMLEQLYGFRLSLTRKLLSGLAYPLFVLHFAFFIGPIPYAVLGRISWADYFRNVLSAIILLWGSVFVFYLLFKFFSKNNLLRKVFDVFLLLIPLLGKALRHMAYERFCRSFYMLYSAGVPIVDAAEMAVGMTGNSAVSTQFKGAAESVRSGEAMYKGFSKSIPAEIRNLWEVGEESGELDKVSRKLADIYLESAQRWFNEFIFWLPKMVYFCILIYMAFLILRNAASVFGELYKIPEGF